LSGVIRRLVIFLALAGPLIASPLAAAQDAPVPEGRILDEADVLSALFELNVNGRLNDLEVRTGIDIAIMTVPSLEGASEEEYATMMLDRWRSVSTGTKHSALLLLATRDRSFTTQVRLWLADRQFEGRPDAYWFEKGVMPPSFVDQLESILSPAVTPHFGKDDWEGGILAGLDAVTAAIPENTASGETAAGGGT